MGRRDGLGEVAEVLNDGLFLLVDRNLGDLFADGARWFVRVAPASKHVLSVCALGLAACVGCEQHLIFVSEVAAIVIEAAAAVNIFLGNAWAAHACIVIEVLDFGRDFCPAEPLRALGIANNFLGRHVGFVPLFALADVIARARLHAHG